MTDKAASTDQNILIRGVNWVGDAVMTLPALRAVRKALPHGRISLLVKPSVAALYGNCPSIDEIILYEERFKGLGGMFRLAGTLRKRNFAQAILFQNAFEAALIALLAGIPRRVGYDRDGRGMLLTNRIPYSGEDRRMHHIKYFLEMIRRSGMAAEPSEPWLCLSLDERLLARERLSALKRPIVGLNPGAAYGSAKQWFPDRFAEVARRVVEELGGSAVVFGGQKEGAIANEIMVLSGHAEEGSVISLAGQTTLRELAGLISECDLLVTNDSGPMHIGYSVKTPLVAIFGSTDPALTGPVGERNAVIRKFIDCAPCFERQCRVDTLKCMDLISSGEVFDNAKRLLPTGKAVFFDRDGTLCEDADYLSRWDDFKVFPDVNAVKQLINKDFQLIGISNQSGIARGIVEEQFVREVNEVFIVRYGFHDFYFCPHHPDEGCHCRKPEPGMLLRAREEHGIDLKRSYMIGDNEKDMLAARAVGARSILVQTGHTTESVYADFIARNLKEAVNWILKDSVY